jgi:hypothetical protein
MEMSQGNSLCSYFKQTKTSLFSFKNQRTGGHNMFSLGGVGNTGRIENVGKVFTRVNIVLALCMHVCKWKKLLHILRQNLPFTSFLLTLVTTMALFWILIYETEPIPSSTVYKLVQVMLCFPPSLPRSTFYLSGLDPIKNTSIQSPFFALHYLHKNIILR